MGEYGVNYLTVVVLYNGLFSYNIVLWVYELS